MVVVAHVTSSAVLYTVAERLLNKSAEKPVKIIGSTLTLERYSSSQSPAGDSSTISGRCVVVSGVTQDIDVEEELVPLLENKRKGGGPVEKAERLSLAEDSVLVTFIDQSGIAYVFTAVYAFFGYITSDKTVSNIY